MYEPYYLIILNKLYGKGWIDKYQINTTLDKTTIDTVLKELRDLNLIHLEVLVMFEFLVSSEESI